MLAANFYITTMQSQYTAGVAALLYDMYAETHPEYVDYFTEQNFRQHIRRFPLGQFVAIADDRVVAFASTMRTQYSPNDKPQSWFEAVGDCDLKNHNPQGDWLYGVDFAVHPDYRMLGIGKAMYKVRFDLCRRLNLRGFYAGGMLRGYEAYRHLMSVREYGEKVMRGEIFDPTVSVQMKQGFVPTAIIDYYDDFAPSNDSAMLIVWHNKHYVEKQSQPTVEAAAAGV